MADQINKDGNQQSFMFTYLLMFDYFPVAAVFIGFHFSISCMLLLCLWICFLFPVILPLCLLFTVCGMCFMDAAWVEAQSKFPAMWDNKVNLDFLLEVVLKYCVEVVITCLI